MNRTLAPKICKVIFYILLSVVVGRFLGNPEVWFNHNLAIRIGHWIYGTGETGAENIYDIYFYVSVITVFSITTVIYMLAMRLLKIGLSRIR